MLEASSGDEALALFESHDGEIDLLLTDIVMPEMGGADLASELLRRDPHLKVLFVSGYSPDIGILGEVSGKGIELMQKPFSRDGLSRTVRAVLDSDRAGSAADEGAP